MDRRQDILRDFPAGVSRALELAPLFRPILLKSECQVDYVDYLETEELRRRDASHPEIANLVGVDVVWAPGARLSSCTGPVRYDYVVASHVLEHVPNPIDWLNQILEVCNPGASVVLALPTPNSHIDRLRRTTALADWVGSFVEGRDRPSASQVFDCLIHARAVSGPMELGRMPDEQVKALPPSYSPASALDFATLAHTSNRYIDVHCGVYTPESLQHLIAGSRELRLLDIEVVDIRYPVGGEAQSAVEFYVTLRKPPGWTIAQALGRQAASPTQSSSPPPSGARGLRYWNALKTRLKRLWPEQAPVAKAPAPVAQTPAPPAEPGPACPERRDAALSPAFPFCHPIQFPNGRSLIHTIDHHRLFLDMSEPLMALHLIEHGSWEDHIRALMRRLFRDGTVFVDVGANIGVHTLFAAALCGPSGRVVAVEPHPAIHALLRDNVELNSFAQKVELHACLITDSDQTETSFEYFVQHPAMSGLRVSAARLDRFRGQTETLNVRSRTLDSLLARDIDSISVIKLDIEGFELLALMGAQRLLESNSDICVILEHTEALATEMMGEDACMRLRRLAASHQMTAFQILPDGLLRPIAMDEAWPDGDLLLARHDSAQLSGLLA